MQHIPGMLLHVFNMISNYICTFRCANFYVTLQEMERETTSFEALLQGLMNLGVCLYPTAPESRIRDLRDELTQIQERCCSVKNSIKHR